MTSTRAVQTAIRASTPAARAGRVLAAAIRRTRRGARPRPRAAARAALVAVVFLAVLPSVFPYDHLLHEMDAHAGHAGGALHASHCHASPATCSDAPVTSGPGQLLSGAPMVVVPSMLAVLLLVTVPVLPGITRRPEIRPPLHATY